MYFERLLRDCKRFLYNLMFVGRLGSLGVGRGRINPRPIISFVRI